ncbi:MAG: sigma-70 family RNA polymerase sigma factor [Anaerolineae bacterium]|nr:sigma-70 family RNA polymerase sigma factor [Anaerolineae bacterium]MDW8172913.1 sigma-70 family RNA polymerase sigma factor [Anaerolineae bacterium]
MADLTLSDEATLIRQAQAGNLEAFNALVLRHQDVVYNVVYRMLGDDASAQDVTQEAFISAYRKFASFQGGHFRAWVVRIASNQALDVLRRDKRRPAESLDDLADEGDLPLPDGGPTPEQALQSRELQRAIQQCLESLNPEQRLTLILCDVQGMSYQEVADSTNAQLGTVKSRLARARLAVRRCLQAVEELLPAQYRLS